MEEGLGRVSYPGRRVIRTQGVGDLFLSLTIIIGIRYHLIFLAGLVLTLRQTHSSPVRMLTRLGLTFRI